MSPAFIDNDGRLDWRKIGYHARSAFAVLLALAVLVGGGWFIYDKANDAYLAWRTTDDYIGEGTGEIQVVIPRGAGAVQMGDILTEAGVVKSTKAFREAAQDSGQANKIQAGRYKLKKELPAETAFQMLLDPANQVRFRITFPEGTTLAQQWGILRRKAPDITTKQLQTIAWSGELTNLPDYANGRLEGYLFPSTYDIGDPPDPADLMRRQISEYNRVAKKLALEGRAAELGRSPHEIVTAASIIASEVSKAEYQPMVAAVIYNRLDKDMKLEMDSTVHYAVGKVGTVTTTQEERKNPSPFNTYLHKGLPPGPISNPGETALAAALTPADTDALFFVTVNLDTGETKFAATLEEHNKNVEQWRGWCKANPGKGC